ncbi:gliding motility-associated C-terminal domain-containing protein [Niastella sp. OAS944]|uniref:T9SS type B sorting domain-containing protein n=1 Tax=Niastella sp. OAS944 TaxID=2664089 RepID=UPI003471DEF8|nr:gliding motility-associated-like protein [Chitinophagaceae bacterium OAS944]
MSVAFPDTKTFAITMLLWVCMPYAFSQPVDLNHKSTTAQIPQARIQQRTQATEICGNLIDDDNNGLTDEKDFSCYLNSSQASCKPSSIIWACEAFGSLFWGDLNTGIWKHVGIMPVSVVDITWASNGKLYGCGGFPNGIYEIDPGNAGMEFVKGLDNYTVSNAMTADAAGNLYVVAYDATMGVQIVKVNLATWEICVIANLTTANLGSAGDLTFMDGMLYLSCTNNSIAKIDVRTGAITTKKFINSTTIGYFGLTNLGDGFLYVADRGNIYQVDPVTMTVNSTPSIVIGSANIFIYGVASYAELCQAPTCTVKTNIQPVDNSPICANLGTQLKAALSSCNNKVTSVWWTTPDGNNVNGDQVKAIQEGKYYLNYQTINGACNRMDSFNVQFAVNAPLKVETNFKPPRGCSCTGSVTVIAGCGSGNFKYEWSNGATTPTLSNVCAGNYSVKVTDLTSHKDTTLYFNMPAASNFIQTAIISTVGDHCSQHDGSITIDKVQGGTPPYKYALNSEPTGNDASFKNLRASNYTITIYDDAGCSLQKQVAVQPVAGPEKLWLTKKDAYCGLPAGMLIIDSVRKGTATLSFSINNSPFSKQTNYTNIPPGANTLIVKDNFGCTLKESFFIEQSPALKLAINPKDTLVCATQKVTFNATVLSNNTGIQYIWNNLQPTTKSTFNTTINSDTRTTIQAIDINGCMAFDTAIAKTEYCDTLFTRCVMFPSAFSPNHDGLNELFGPHIGQCEIKNYKMVIYNRWGQMIFQTNNIHQRWNGETNGYIQVTGTYVFNCVWEDGLGLAHQVKGTVALIK